MNGETKEDLLNDCIETFRLMGGDKVLNLPSMESMNKEDLGKLLAILDGVWAELHTERNKQ